MSQNAATSSESSELGWNPEDPHGSIQHEHHIISWQILLLVLLALLGFTALTLGVYNLEAWIEDAFGIHIPRWINVIGAMSIATLKALLVCAFFMQLRYDKALNTFAMLFCLFCVALFLAITMIDIGTRGAVHDYRAPSAVAGGTGVGLDAPPRDEDFSIRLSPYIATGGMSIVDFRRQEAIDGFFDTEKGKKYAHKPAYEGNPEKAWWHAYYTKYSEYGYQHPFDTQNYFTSLGFAPDEGRSTANRSIPRHGLTAGLFDEVAPADHAGEKANDAADH